MYIITKQVNFSTLLLTNVLANITKNVLSGILLVKVLVFYCKEVLCRLFFVCYLPIED